MQAMGQLPSKYGEGPQNAILREGQNDPKILAHFSIWCTKCIPKNKSSPWKKSPQFFNTRGPNHPWKLLWLILTPRWNNAYIANLYSIYHCRLNPEIFLKRPAVTGEKWRVDSILKRKAVSWFHVLACKFLTTI